MTTLGVRFESDCEVDGLGERLRLLLADLELDRLLESAQVVVHLIGVTHVRDVRHD